MLNIAGVLSPVQYLRELGWEPFEWQIQALQPCEQLLLNCCRQAGKSTVVAAKAVHRAKYFPGSLILIITPTERQSKEVMKKIEAFMSHDKTLPALETNNTLEKEFVNKSRILALPGSEKTVRGYSDPNIIILDESSRIPDELFEAITPMMAGEITELIQMSTPFGKRGFFYESYEHDPSWKKIEVVGRDILGDWKSELEYKTDRAAKGIIACYSPRHTEKFLLKELHRPGKSERWFRQEYCGEFMETDDALFSYEEIQEAFTDAFKPALSKEEVFSEEECYKL